MPADLKICRHVCVWCIQYFCEPKRLCTYINWDVFLEAACATALILPCRQSALPLVRVSVNEKISCGRCKARPPWPWLFTLFPNFATSRTEVETLLESESPQLVHKCSGPNPGSAAWTQYPTFGQSTNFASNDTFADRFRLKVHVGLASALSWSS